MAVPWRGALAVILLVPVSLSALGMSILAISEATFNTSCEDALQSVGSSRSAEDWATIPEEHDGIKAQIERRQVQPFNMPPFINNDKIYLEWINIQPFSSLLVE